MVGFRDTVSSQRSDTALRQAISSLETLLLSELPADQILQRCLDQLVVLLESSFGYVFRAGSVADTTDMVPWELASCVRSEGGVLRRISNSCTSDCVPAEWKTLLLAGRCIIGGEADRSMPIPHYHPVIGNFVCVPLVDARQFYGAVFVCNVRESPTLETANRLRPFMAAAGCLFRSASVRSRFGMSFLQSHPGEWIDVLDAVFNAVLVVNDANVITLCNRAASRLFEVPCSDIAGYPLSQFLPRDTLRFEEPLSVSGDNKQGAGHHVFHGVSILSPRGNRLLVDISLVNVDLGGQRLRCLVLDDLSRHLQAVSNYYNTLHRFQVLTNLAPVGILQLNRLWECNYINDALCEYLEITPDEAWGSGWLNGIHDDDVDVVMTSLRKDILMGGSFEGEFRLVSPLGKVIWVKANARCLYEESGDVSGMIMALSDITDRLNNERQLRNIAERDQLTGLINRSFFYDRLETALRGVGRFGQVAVMYLDLDDFKHINDTFGHDAGDQLLLQVSRRLTGTLRRADSIARIGGDEFSVVLTHVQNSSVVNAVADKILQAMSEPIMLENNPVYVTCSIGIAVADTSETDCRQLLKQADSALYRAKASGRNQYKFYTAEMERIATIHVHLRRSLKELQQEFYIVYQPVMDARSGRMTGMEALARWSPEAFSAIGPDVFIRMIEDSGLITDFADWLYADVLATVGLWRQRGILGDVTIAINLSARQFRNADLAQRVMRQCERFQVPPQSIVLEVTETALIDDAELAAATLSALRGMGFAIALDDFGTGYSSLVYLRRMPLDYVKIDRSFVQDVIDDEEDAQIVDAMLGLADKLGLKVVAEGVASREVSEWLLQRACPVQQGFYFHQPLNHEDAAALLVRQSESGTL